jgi:hypothetical protein
MALTNQIQIKIRLSLQANLDLKLSLSLAKILFHPCTIGWGGCLAGWLDQIKIRINQHQDKLDLKLSLCFAKILFHKRCNKNDNFIQIREFKLTNEIEIGDSGNKRLRFVSSSQPSTIQEEISFKNIITKKFQSAAPFVCFWPNKNPALQPQTHMCAMKFLQKWRNKTMICMSRQVALPLPILCIILVSLSHSHS